MEYALEKDRRARTMETEEKKLITKAEELERAAKYWSNEDMFH